MGQNQDCLHGAGECVQDIGQCDSGCLAKKAAGCQGANCGTTDGLNHSPECIVEAAACQGWLNSPEAVEALLKVMVDRFLGWKLPADFCPDSGIAFKSNFKNDSPHWPSGTNLLHAGQALEMFKHCLPVDLIALAASTGHPFGTDTVAADQCCSSRDAMFNQHLDEPQCGGKCEKPADTRAEFEDWVRSVPFFAHFDWYDGLERDDTDNGYLDANVHAAWLAWNARGEA